MLGKNLIQAAAGSGGEVLNVEDVFSTWLYTGNGSTQTITNGINLSGKGGLVWIKRRNNISWHFLTDTERGTNKQLVSNEDTTGESYTNFITAFNGDGFSLGSNANANNASDTYTSWTFRKAAKFFDVVTYTGTGSARTVAHNLGSVPGCIIVKRTDLNGYSWCVYHRSLGNTSFILLNQGYSVFTGQLSAWNSTTPTSTSFTVGTDSATNANGGTYVAYLFAHDAGGFGDSGNNSVVKCGTYTGTGTTLDIDCGFTSGAGFVLIKRTDSTGDWYVWDTARGIIAANDPFLLLNSSAAENTSTDYIDPLSSGFQISSTAPAAINANGGTYIYLAIA